MTVYKVIYEIETDADSPLEAALQVENYMKIGHFRPVLEVFDIDTDPSNCESVMIDLEELV